MAEYPSLPLFTDAYLSDTRHLTTLQHGAYLLMLMTAWRSPDCCLPDDDIFLARVCGMDRRTWLNNKDVLLTFWQRSLNDNCDNSGASSTGSPTKLFQRRLSDERKYVEQVRNKNIAAGRASALKRQNRGSTSVQPNVNQTSTPIPTLTPILVSHNDKSLFDTSGTGEEKEDDLTGEKQPKKPPTPYEKLISIWNSTGLPKVLKLHDKRKRLLAKAFREDFDESLENWENYCKYIADSDFLSGRKTSWKADFDWAIETKNITKIEEGKYDETAVIRAIPSMFPGENGEAIR